jgi:pyruvate kinase
MKMYYLQWEIKGNLDILGSKMIHTKMICTIGPSCESYESIVALIQAGMNIARLNFSHGTYEEHQVRIDRLKQARKELGVPLAIMLDTRGPEVRIGKIKEGSLSLKKGDRWKFIKDVVEGDAEKVSIRPPHILDSLVVGCKMLLNDGYLCCQVEKKEADGVTVIMENDGIITSGKGVNIPNISLDLPAVTERDIQDISFGCQNDIDIIAASFVRTPENIITIKNLLSKEGKPETLIIAKIESKEGVKNFDSILQIADGVMIARGDLGVELPISQVPKLQKEMIRKCYLAGKPSVTATQMLESMINNPRPTRAEVSDVANAIYDSTSAVMLSGETAAGKYPIETVHVMKSIIKEAEADFNYRAFFDKHAAFVYNDVASAVTLATVKTSYSAGAQAIFILTQRGTTARLISRLRPGMPILAMTPHQKCFHQMSLNWGVIPYLSNHVDNVEEAFERLSSYAIQREIVSYGDLVVMTAGSTFGVSGTTNMMIVENIGDVLVRAHSGIGKKVYGKVALLLSPEGRRPFEVRDALIVIPKCDSSFAPFIEESIGVVLQNHVDDQESERVLLEFAKDMGKTALIRADSAFSILKEGGLVTLDPEKALIYKGVVI